MSLLPTELDILGMKIKVVNRDPTTRSDARYRRVYAYETLSSERLLDQPTNICIFKRKS